MVRSILLVFASLVGLSYAALFLMWNANTKADIVTWGLGETLWVGGIPVGFLVLVGALVGAVGMVLGVWGPWAGLSASARASEAKLQKAVARLNEQKRQLAARDEEISRLNAARQVAASEPEAVVVAGEPEAVAGGEPEAAGGETPEAATGDDVVA